ncbi:hypothetical protein [Streptomyces bacillaris]|uniref:hypothetical protein n=1 Tax=Streptomyces bacillaris TaxID=68179 RepID=UPI0036284D04
MNKLRELLKNEPVAAAVGAIVAAVFAYLVTSGAMTADTADFVAAVLTVVLGVPIAVGVRSKVTPVDRPRAEE